MLCSLCHCLYYIDLNRKAAYRKHWRLIPVCVCADLFTAFQRYSKTVKPALSDHPSVLLKMVFQNTWPVNGGSLIGTVVGIRIVSNV